MTIFSEYKRLFVHGLFSNSEIWSWGQPNQTKQTKPKQMKTLTDILGLAILLCFTAAFQPKDAFKSKVLGILSFCSSQNSDAMLKSMRPWWITHLPTEVLGIRDLLFISTFWKWVCNVLGHKQWELIKMLKYLSVQAEATLYRLLESA